MAVVPPPVPTLSRAPGAVNFRIGTFAFAATATSTGAGTTNFDGATVNFGTSNTTLSNPINLSGSLLSGSGTLTFNSALTWSGGTISVPTVVNANTTLAGGIDFLVAATFTIPLGKTATQTSGSLLLGDGSHNSITPVPTPPLPALSATTAETLPSSTTPAPLSSTWPVPPTPSPSASPSPTPANVTVQNGNLNIIGRRQRFHHHGPYNVNANMTLTFAGDFNFTGNATLTGNGAAVINGTNTATLGVSIARAHHQPLPPDQI